MGLSLASSNRMNGAEEQSTPYGKRLLPCILDDEAQINPERVFSIITRSNDIKHGFKEVTFRQVANAVNWVATRLQKSFGATPDYEFETLTFIGLPDLRYPIVVFAAIKCGYKVRLL